MKTYMAKPKEIERKWHLVDAEDKILGRLASEIAHILRGKDKATFTPHLDTGDFVVVINASKIRLTGDKLAKKSWYRHSGYPGGLKEEKYEKVMESKPDKALLKAVKGMLPNSMLGAQQLKKLKVYANNEHPHAQQKPAKLEI
ncbi:MAG TPA: 50S ribosomal protein L13 [Actinobacteria bacterium]|nr:50S ribosomal protein L13 [Actinomycetota bacterium]